MATATWLKTGAFWLNAILVEGARHPSFHDHGCHEVFGEKNKGGVQMAAHLDEIFHVLLEPVESLWIRIAREIEVNDWNIETTGGLAVVNKLLDEIVANDDCCVDVDKSFVLLKSFENFLNNDGLPRIVFNEREVFVFVIDDLDVEELSDFYVQSSTEVVQKL